MAHRGAIGKIDLGPVAHLPTWMLVAGAPVFWLELYGIRLPGGHTSPVAWIVWGTIAAIVLAGYRPSFKIPSDLIVRLGIALALVYVAAMTYASLLPPHLPQEGDALNYHLMLPRQHLLRHSFDLIPWSAADLFLIPLDYALAPFALSTFYPNKLPQMVFFFGMLGCVFHIVSVLAPKDKLHPVVAVLAVMSLHLIAIQAGIAMMDVVMVYCFLAFLHSLWCKRFGWAGIELSFFVWSKPLLPVQTTAVVVVLVLIAWALARYKFTPLEWPSGKLPGARLAVFFAATSSVMALPCAWKTFYYTGTPFYPFGVGLFHPLHPYAPEQWQAVLSNAHGWALVRQAYGHGGDLSAWAQHFWRIAVPEQGVNNAYDYPVGLVYLLVLVPFALHLVSAFKDRKVPVLSLLVVLAWMSWWFGSQQTRFLMVPFCLMVMVTIASMQTLSRIFLCCVIMALGVETMSVVRAHKADWGRSAQAVLRVEDRHLLEIAKNNPPMVTLNFSEAAFAPFPVSVSLKDSIFVFSQPLK